MHHRLALGIAASATFFVAACSANTDAGRSDFPVTNEVSGTSHLSQARIPDFIRNVVGSGSRKGLNVIDASSLPASVYVATFNGPVNEYGVGKSKSKTVVCQVLGVKNINAIGVDAGGNLWVPQQVNNGQGNEIVSFAKNCGIQGPTLFDSTGASMGITFGPRGRTYVVDNYSVYAGVNASIAVFPRHQNVPKSLLTDPSIYFIGGAGVDSNGDVYAQYTSQPYGSASVIKFVGGKMPGVILSGVHFGNAGGSLQFDHSGNMILPDSVNATVYVYAPPYNGTPNTIPLKGASWQCSLNRLQTLLACADFSNTSVDFYSYPSGTYKYSITSGFGPSSGPLLGVAFDPSAKN